MQSHAHNRTCEVIFSRLRNAIYAKICNSMHTMRFGSVIESNAHKTKSQWNWSDTYVMSNTMRQAKWCPWKTAIHHFPQMIIVRLQSVEKRIVSYLPGLSYRRCSNRGKCQLISSLILQSNYLIIIFTILDFN